MKEKVHGIWLRFRRELQVQNFKLHHEDASVFCKSQWSNCKSKNGNLWSDRAYLVYKWVVSIYLVGAFLSDFLVEQRKEKCVDPRNVCLAKWPIFLTNWAYFMLMTQAVLSTFLVTRYQFFPQKSNEMQFSHKLYWLFNNISNGMAPLISIMYWGFVYNPALHFLDFFNVKEHITNMVLMLIDLLICAHPVRLLHFYQPFLVGLSYPIFTVIYFAFGGTSRLGFPYIYGILNWEKPGTAVIITIATLVFELLIFFIVWCIYLARAKVATLCECENDAPMSDGSSKECA